MRSLGAALSACKRVADFPCIVVDAPLVKWFIGKGRFNLVLLKGGAGHRQF